MIQFWWQSGSRFGYGSPKSEIRILWIGGGLCSLSIAFLFSSELSVLCHANWVGSWHTIRCMALSVTNHRAGETRSVQTRSDKAMLDLSSKSGVKRHTVMVTSWLRLLTLLLLGCRGDLSLVETSAGVLADESTIAPPFLGTADVIET